MFVKVTLPAPKPLPPPVNALCLLEDGQFAYAGRGSCQGRQYLIQRIPTGFLIYDESAPLPGVYAFDNVVPTFIAREVLPMGTKIELTI